MYDIAMEIVFISVITIGYWFLSATYHALKD